jgi:hypothetical protein
LSSERGSSSEKERRREDGTPEDELDTEVRRDGCEELAREASSRESRVGTVYLGGIV